MSDRRALHNLEAQSIDRVLGELAELAAREKRGEEVRLPPVTLHLRSGRDLRGVVLAIGSRDGAVLFQSGEDDAVHVAPSSIEALTRHEVRSAGRPPMRTEDAPTKLELRRRAASLAPPVTIEEGDPDPEARIALSALLDEIGEALKGISEDAMGREAMAEKIRRVELRLGSGAAVSLSGGTLTLTTTAHWPSRLSGADLRARIESLL